MFFSNLFKRKEKPVKNIATLNIWFCNNIDYSQQYISDLFVDFDEVNIYTVEDFNLIRWNHYLALAFLNHGTEMVFSKLNMYFSKTNYKHTKYDEIIRSSREIKLPDVQVRHIMQSLVKSIETARAKRPDLSNELLSQGV